MKFIFFNENNDLVELLNEKFKDKSNIIAVKSNLSSLYSYLDYAYHPVIVVPIITNGNLLEKTKEEYEPIIPNLSVIIKNKVKETLPKGRKHLTIGSSILFPLDNIQIIALVSYFPDENEKINDQRKWLMYHLHSFLFSIQKTQGPDIIETLLVPYLDIDNTLQKDYINDLIEAFLKGIPQYFKAPQIKEGINTLYTSA